MIGPSEQGARAEQNKHVSQGWTTHFGLPLFSDPAHDDPMNLTDAPGHDPQNLVFELKVRDCCTEKNALRYLAQRPAGSTWPCAVTLELGSRGCVVLATLESCHD